jgi:hypothetical protein
VICTDKSMAAAGGNNRARLAVRLFNPDFHLDPGQKTALDQAVLSPQVRDAFNRQGSFTFRKRNPLC